MIIGSVYVGKVGLVVHSATIDNVRKSDSRSCVEDFLRHIEILKISYIRFHIVRAAVLTKEDGKDDIY